MRVAGVRTANGQLVWVDAGTMPLRVQERVEIEVSGDRVEGIVYVAPDDILIGPKCATGILVAVLPEQCLAAETTTIPGAEYPPLGTSITWCGEPRTVTAVIHADRCVVLTSNEGIEIRASLDEVVHA